MVRNYRRKSTRGQSSVETLQKAVEAVHGGTTFRQAAQLFSVNKDTLWRAVNKSNQRQQLTTFTEGCRTRQVFIPSEESELVKYIITASRMGFPLDSKTLRSLAYQLAQRNMKTYPANWDEKGQAGEDWLLGFQKRHKTEISNRTPESTSISRATGFNRTNVQTFYKKLSELYDRHAFTPECIYNLDETGLTTSQKPTRVVAEAGVKQVAQLISYERGETVTMLGFINAVGNAVPPCLIFPRVNFKGHMLQNAPPGSRGFANRSGWMTKEIFIECLRHFASFSCCSRNRKVLIILDNHESHISLNAVDFCRENGIILLSFPPHTSHRLQPLDRTVFGPFKRSFYAASNDWMYSNPGKRITIHNIAGLVGIAHPRAFTASNIISGFKCTGIFPLDTEIFSDADFIQCFMTDRPALGTEMMSDVPPEETPSSANVQPDSLQNDSHFEAVSAVAKSHQPISMNTASKFPSFSPENIRPLLKSSQKSGRKFSKGRKGRCRILTDTPEKAQLEEAAIKKRTAPPKSGKTGSKKRRLFECPLLMSRTDARKTCLMASYSQGDDLFSPDTKGRQCIAMATAAAVYTNIKPINSWNRCDLDLILLSGDMLYGVTCRQQPVNEHGYLLILDIPNRVTLFNKKFQLNRTQASCGLVSSNQLSEESITLDKAVKNIFMERSSAILIIKDSSTMIHKDQEGTCYVFDSHSRNEKGMLSNDGKSILMKLKDVDDLLLYLHEVAAALTDGVAVYEVVGVETIAEDHREDKTPSSETAMQSSASSEPANQSATCPDQDNLSATCPDPGGESPASQEPVIQPEGINRQDLEPTSNLANHPEETSTPRCGASADSHATDVACLFCGEHFPHALERFGYNAKAASCGAMKSVQT